MRKKPRYKIEPLTQKSAHVAAQNQPDSFSGKRPVWRVSVVDHKGPWGWDRIRLDEFLKIIERLKSFETMTWGEVTGKENHFMEVKRVCKEARKRLAEIRLDDIDTLYSLRMNQRQRLWGIRDNEVFKILWWDPRHTVYPVSPGNT